MSSGQFPWKLVSFRLPTETVDAVHLGVLDGARVVDLATAFAGAKRAAPEGMRQLFEWFPTDELAQWLARAIRGTALTYPLNAVTVLAPMTNPRMFYDFLGFEQHVRQIRARRGATVPELWYKRPAYYIGSVAPDKLLGPGPVVLPRFVEKPDYECELALVVGRTARPTTVAEATAFIQTHCYFTLCNDWSARDYQKYDMDLGLGVSHSKAIGGTSFGPILVHASQFPFGPDGVPDVAMQVTVNGVTRGDGNYRSVYWNFAKILAFLGQENIGVFPGDIFGSGTMGNGCIAEFAAKVIDGREVEPAKYPWLGDGDVITLKATGIGELTNTVVIT